MYRHLKRFMGLYDKKTGFEICQTFRFEKYTDKVEMSVIATRDYEPGYVIKNLVGVSVEMSREEDENLQNNGGRDFSVLWSTKKRAYCLLLGPARFVNHDCEPNVEVKCIKKFKEFIPSSGNDINFKVIKPIKTGKEILVYYGNDYFGPNNVDCHCETCEK
ncbi:SET domain-containing protein [Rozella allomycis CSF55]|uniref:SET domain-containing protein n=1 Tax=Rozella allomycis (strain CSF55) TaxID=988480 RepID=A0A4P9YMH8_ROZAC|nr:SET domain-containing protein [Rozella allomycis CSF55]